MTLREKISRAIGAGLDVADPMVGNVVEEQDLLAAADAVLTTLRDSISEDMVERGARAIYPYRYIGGDWIETKEVWHSIARACLLAAIGGEG